MLRRRETVPRIGQVTIEKDGVVYNATYELLPGSGVLRLVTTDQRIRLAGFTAEQAAQILLLEAISTGLADREGLARPCGDPSHR